MATDPIPCAAATALDRFLTERNLSSDAAGKALDVSKTAVQKWRSGEQLPDDANRDRIEIFCARVPPRLLPDGRLDSHVPKSLWPSEVDARPAVQPYDFRIFAALSVSP